MAYSPDAQQLVHIDQKPLASPSQPQQPQSYQASYVQPEFHRQAESQQQIEASKHTGCLTLWALFGIIATGILLILSLKGGVSGDPINAVPILSISISVATLIGYIGVLLLKRWGYYLVLSMYILVTIARMAIVANSPVLIGNQGKLAILGGMLGGIIFFALCRSALQYME